MEDEKKDKAGKSRIWRACVACRKRKIRCNGAEPCSMCISKGEECVYAETKDRHARHHFSREKVTDREQSGQLETARPAQLPALVKLTPLRYVAHLESRLAQVESALIKIAEGGSAQSLPLPLPSPVPFAPVASTSKSNAGSVPGSASRPTDIPTGLPPTQLSAPFTFSHQSDADLSALLSQNELSTSQGPASYSYTSEKQVGSPPTALAWVTESDAYASPGASDSAGSAAAAGLPDNAEVEELTREFSHIAVDRRGELRFNGGGTIGILIESIGALKPRDGQTPYELPFIHSPVPLSGGGRGEAAWLPRASDFGFPPRDVLIRLVETYFKRVHPLFPILNRSAFTRKLAKEESRNDTPFAALVFAVCAAASMLVPGYGTQASTAVGNEWLERASILHYRCSRETSLAHVQCLGIMGSYLAAINDLPAAWLVTGQAMRTAQDLGLHRATSRLKLSPSDIQERRRVFWCLYGQDRCMSYALGRSMGIDDADVDVELPFDLDEDDLAKCQTLQDAISRSKGKPCLMSGFIALTQMHILARKAKKAHRSIDRIPNTVDPSSFSSLNRFCEPLDAALSRWLRNLPACIRDATEEDADQTFWMQSVQCFSQYHTTRMNAFRPVISGARTVRCFGPDEDEGGATTYFHKVRASATSAAGLGTVIRRAIAASHELAFAVEQTLLAGVILARCVPLCRDSSTAETTAAAARTCVSSLAALETWPGASRCREILDDLVTQIVSNDRSERLLASEVLVSPKGVKRAAEEAFSNGSGPSLWMREMPAPAIPAPNKRQSVASKAAMSSVYGVSPTSSLSPSNGLETPSATWDGAFNFASFASPALSPGNALHQSSFDFTLPTSSAAAASATLADRPFSPGPLDGIQLGSLEGMPFPGLDWLTNLGSDGAMNWE